MARASLKSQLEQAQEEIKVLRATLEKLLQNTPEVVSTPEPELRTEPQPQSQPELRTEPQPQSQPELRIEPESQSQPELRIEPEPKTKTQQPSSRIQGYQTDKEQRIKTLDRARMAWRTIDQEHRTHYLQSLGKKFLTNDDLLHFFTTVYPNLNLPLTFP